jgi:hypothetical protein
MDGCKIAENVQEQSCGNNTVLKCQSPVQPATDDDASGAWNLPS